MRSISTSNASINHTALMLKSSKGILNHKLVCRVYCVLSLNLRIKPKKRLPSRKPVELHQPACSNEFWSMVFMSDSLFNGKKFRTLNIIDDFNKESLAIEVDFSLPSEWVVRVLNQLSEWRGYQKFLRVDNGPELISTEFTGLGWKAQRNDKLYWTRKTSSKCL